MSNHSIDGINLYEYAMNLFFKAGHAVTTHPVYTNHSSEQTVYFDFRRIVSLTRSQRQLLRTFSNVSRLFSFNNCSFFSIVLLTSPKNRSQAAHDIHTLIHLGMDSKGTICLFKCEDEVVLSFMGFGLKCILSDWYPIDDDNGTLLDRLHVVNMSIDRDVDYFSDMLYSLARKYYFANKTPSVYELIPVNYFTGVIVEEINRDALNQIVIDELKKVSLEYGDDYLEYDDSKIPQTQDIGAELDMMLLDMNETLEDIDDDFENSIASSDVALGINDNLLDEYEFNDVDPEIFRDPTLMVKFLEKAASTNDHTLVAKHNLCNKTENELFALLDREAISYIDNRDKGGALWIIGGHELDRVIKSCDALGFKFRYSEKGGRATGRLPGWYLKSE